MFVLFPIIIVHYHLGFLSPHHFHQQLLTGVHNEEEDTQEITSLAIAASHSRNVFLFL